MMTTPYVVEALARVPLFEDLPGKVLERLARQVIPIQLETNDLLFRQGDPGDSMFVIQSGCVRVVTSGLQEQELVIDRYGPGEIVGELSMIDQEPRSAGVVAAEPTKMLKLPRAAFLEVLLSQPNLAFGVLRNLSTRLRFTAAYLQKAVEWAGHIASGDYPAAISQMETARGVPSPGPQPGARRQEEFLAAFIKMVEVVQDREEALKAQLQAFQIQIDEARRQDEVENLLGSQFFQKLEQTLRKRNPESGQASDADPDPSQNPAA